MNIIEQNKKLAKFMNYNITEFQWKNYETLAFCNENSYVDFEDILYYNPHQDWSQLMELIEAIEKIGCIIEISYSLVVNCRICWIGKKHCEAAINFINDNNGELKPIEAIYKSVVEFVNWYDENIVKN